ncbi:MAG: PH domain-containing protein [Candidatus Aminicenantales bacterium]
MAKIVWKKLKKEDLNKLIGYLEAMPDDKKPLYGLVGVKRNELLSWIIGSFNKPHVVYFTKDGIVLSRRTLFTLKEVNSRAYPIDGLKNIDVRRGVLLDSIQFEFNDGSKIRLRDVPKHQADPIEKFVTSGVGAFDKSNLSDEQITNCYFAYRNADLIPKDVLS